jgi:hypothetical protein
MQEFEHIKILFVAGFGPIAAIDGTPVPQAWLEFDVAEVEGATATLESRGGQTVTRFLSPEGLLVGLTVTPSMRRS